MKVKRGVSGIIFDEQNGLRYFLLLHRVLNWNGWEFCKGGIDGNESERDAVLREINEETGLENVSILATLPKKISWTSNGKKYVYTPFLLRGSMSDAIDLHQQIIEHNDFRWVRESEVENMLTHSDNRKIFREVLLILNKNNS